MGAANLVAKALGGDDGDLIAHSLVGLEVESELGVVPLNDDLGGLLDSLRTNATHFGGICCGLVGWCLVLKRVRNLATKCGIENVQKRINWSGQKSNGCGGTSVKSKVDPRAKKVCTYVITMLSHMTDIAITSRYATNSNTRDILKERVQTRMGVLFSIDERV